MRIALKTTVISLLFGGLSAQAANTTIFGNWTLSSGEAECSKTLQVGLRTGYIEMLSDKAESTRLPLGSYKIADEIYADSCPTVLTVDQRKAQRICAFKFTGSGNASNLKINMQHQWTLALNQDNSMSYSFFSLGMPKKRVCTYVDASSANPVNPTPITPNPAEPTPAPTPAPVVPPAPVVIPPPQPAPPGLRVEPNWPVPTYAGEKYQYEQSSPRTYGEDKIGRSGQALNTLPAMVTLQTLKAGRIVEWTRTINPCSSINVNGQGDDPRKCQPVFFDEWVPGELLTKTVSLKLEDNLNTSQLPDVKVVVSLGIDGTLPLSVEGKSDQFIGVRPTAGAVNGFTIVTDAVNPLLADMANMISNVKLIGGEKPVLQFDIKSQDVTAFDYAISVYGNGFLGLGGDKRLDKTVESKDLTLVNTVEPGKSTFSIAMEDGKKVKVGGKFDISITATIKDPTLNKISKRYQIIYTPQVSPSFKLVQENSKAVTE